MYCTIIFYFRRFYYFSYKPFLFPAHERDLLTKSVCMD